MSRPRTTEPYVQQKISLPATLMARFSLHHFDPIHNKTRYGAISAVLSRLLSDYMNRIDAGHPPMEIKDTPPS